MTGSSFGNYRVEEQIGKGGMGVVYRAIDTKLGRSVAIKVLPDECAKDPARRARFEREARLLAALNHTHIAAIHGLEEFDGVCALVLEYVPGDTLDKRLSSGPLPLKEALKICVQIADALESAHAKGIIHRDLKPANVKITPEESVKVLDFGLAKALEQGPVTTGPDDSTALETQANVVMGTPAYMSPEQAQAKPLDRRADVWAFGCILYELLAGRRAFPGATPSEVLAAVLAKDPEWKALGKEVPGRVRLLLRRCLEKDPQKRLRDIGDARLELEEVLSGAVVEGEETPAKRRPLWPALVAGLLIGAAAMGAWMWIQSRRTPPLQVARFEVPLPQGHMQRVTWNPQIMFTRDGSAVTYLATLPDGSITVFRRPLDSLDISRLTDMKRFGTIVFSPDGKWIAWRDDPSTELRKIGAGGGAPVTLTTTDMFSRGDWGTDKYIYFTERYPAAISRIPENGGEKEPVTKLDAARQEFVHKHAQILPGGRAIIFTVVSAGMESYDDASVELHVLGTKQRKVLVQGGFCARYSPSGHVVYARAGSLYAVPFDIGRFEVTGPSIKVADGVLMSTNVGSAYFDVSPKGALAYAAGVAEGGKRTLVWVDRQGKAEPLALPQRSYLFPRISPDQKTLAVEIEGPTHNLYIYDFARTVMTKMTTDGLSHAPVWTPDGKQLCYRSWKAGTMTMWRMPADRSGPEERLTSIGAWQSPVSVSPDGRYLAFNQGMMPPAVFVLSLDGSGKPQPLVKSSFSEASAKFSPDGKWVAYCSNESGKPEVFVRPWPGPGPKIQISSEGGTDPLWTRKGDEIFYRNADKMMVVAVSLAGGFQAGKPRLLWEGHYSHGMSSSCGPPGVSSGNYDITADGRRFLMVKDNDQDVFSTKLVVVVNWARELTELTNKGKQ